MLLQDIEEEYYKLLSQQVTVRILKKTYIRTFHWLLLGETWFIESRFVDVQKVSNFLDESSIKIVFGTNQLIFQFLQ